MRALLAVGGILALNVVLHVVHITTGGWPADADGWMWAAVGAFLLAGGPALALALRPQVGWQFVRLSYALLLAAFLVTWIHP